MKSKNSHRHVLLLLLLLLSLLKLLLLHLEHHLEHVLKKIRFSLFFLIPKKTFKNLTLHTRMESTGWSAVCAVLTP